MKKAIILTIVMFAVIAAKAQTIPVYVPTDHIVAWYPFTGNAIDSTLNMNNGAVTGATLTADRFGNANSAYHFDASSKIQLVLPDLYAPTSATAYSVSLWFKKENDAESVIWQYMAGTTSAVSSYDFYSDHGGCIAQTVAVQNYPFYNPSACGTDTLSLGRWYHIAIVFDQVADTFGLYKNGMFSFSGPIGSTRPYSGFMTFGNDGGDTLGFLGDIDDIGIWNRALTPCEIYRLYSTSPFTVNPITGPSAVCVGSTLTLTDTSYLGLWSNTTGHATVSAGIVTGASVGVDTIRYTVCGSVSASAPVIVNPLPHPSVTVSGSTLNTGSAYASYQWLLSGSPIPGATDSTYDAPTSGTYSVRVDSNGCSATSSVTTIIGVLVKNINATGDNIKVYPNPSQSVVNIESPVDVDIRLTALDGRALMNKKKVKTIDISSLPAGNYLLSIYDAHSHLKLKTERVVRMVD